MRDPFHLARFIAAQAPVLDQVRGELRAGRKRTHWMWFVFPQLAGLGRSGTAQYYALGSLEEAKAYLTDPALGARLIECTALVNAVRDSSARDIFGVPDDMKFHSCMTLFALAAPDERVFAQALTQYFAGVRDAATLALLARHGG